MNAPRYITVADASARVGGVPISTIYYWIQTGRLKAFRPGRRLLIREDELVRFVEETGAR
jgi:excisionase family DNA binding protein